jgi:hypothetical protein
LCAHGVWRRGNGDGGRRGGMLSRPFKDRQNIQEINVWHRLTDPHLVRASKQATRDLAHGRLCCGTVSVYIRQVRGAVSARRGRGRKTRGRLQLASMVRAQEKRRFQVPSPYPQKGKNHVAQFLLIKIHPFEYLSKNNAEQQTGARQSSRCLEGYPCANKHCSLPSRRFL